MFSRGWLTIQAADAALAQTQRKQLWEAPLLRLQTVPIMLERDTILGRSVQRVHTQRFVLGLRFHPSLGQLCERGSVALHHISFLRSALDTRTCRSILSRVLLAGYPAPGGELVQVPPRRPRQQARP
jgi:hypothetical protein